VRILHTALLASLPQPLIWQGFSGHGITRLSPALLHNQLVIDSQ